MAEKNSLNRTHQRVDEADQRTQTVERGESSNVEVSGNRTLGDRIRNFLFCCESWEANEESDLDCSSGSRKTSEKLAVSTNPDVTKPTETSSKSVEPIGHLSGEIKQEQNEGVEEIHPHLGEVEQSESIDSETQRRMRIFSTATITIHQISSCYLNELKDEGTEKEEANAVSGESIDSSTSLELFEVEGTEKEEANAMSSESIDSSTSLELFEVQAEGTEKEETTAMLEESVISPISQESFKDEGTEKEEANAVSGESIDSSTSLELFEVQVEGTEKEETKAMLEESVISSNSLESFKDEGTEKEEAKAVSEEFIDSSTSLKLFKDEGTEKEETKAMLEDDIISTTYSEFLKRGSIEKKEANVVSEDSIINTTSLDSFNGKNTGIEEAKAMAEPKSPLSSTSSSSFNYLDCQRSKPPTPLKYELLEESDEQDDDLNEKE